MHVCTKIAKKIIQNINKNNIDKILFSPTNANQKYVKASVMQIWFKQLEMKLETEIYKCVHA